MEQLLKSQKADALKIQRILTNFKKDSAKRKTQTNIEGRLKLLNDIWESFEQRNDALEEFKEANLQQPYFATDFFTDVENIYEETKEILEGALNELISKNKCTDEQVKQLKKQCAIIESLKRAISVVESEISAQVSAAYCAQKMKLLSDYWEHVVVNHGGVMAMGEFEDEYFNNNVFAKTEDAYQAIIIILQEKLNGLHTATNHVRTQPDDEPDKRTQVKLPRIDIPIFNGDYLKWQPFRDLFTELIQKNKNMSAAEKLFYLKTNLSGEPSELIQHLHITNENFETAWGILDKRYNNTRTLVSAQLRTLLSQPVLLKESAEGLKKLHDTTTECLEGIKNLDIDTKSWDPLVIYLLTQKLDKETHRLYEQSLAAPRDVQSLAEFLQFLENRFQGLEAIEPSTPSNRQIRPPEKNQKSTRIYHGSVSVPCPICNGGHKIYSCEKFRQLSVQQRINASKKASLCQNCLTSGHNASKCKSWKSCQTCQKKHHTLLHYQSIKPVSQRSTNLSPCTDIDSTKKMQGSSSTTNVTTHLASNRIGLKVLLATAVVLAGDKAGNCIQLRALIDQGSQATFITEDAAQRLRLPRKKAHAIVSGVGGASPGTVQSSIELTLTPRFQSTFSITTTALVLKNLTKFLPTDKVTPSTWKHTSNLILADPTFAIPGKIDIILGAEVYGNIMLENVLRGPEGAPLAQQTELGWILSGGIQNTNKEARIMCLISEVELFNDLQRFWECEDLQCEGSVTTSEDIACENHFRRTHRREQNGRYVVRIPFREDPEETEQLEGSRELALARLFQMERKFKLNKVFETMYKDFMKEYQKLGHMLPADDSTGKRHYLPHHAVLKEDSTTTKLRVVFDASAKRNNTKCLNELMMTGPQIQQNLISILLRWRKHKIVFTADIEKMYRQIKVDVRDQNYQIILWRDSPDNPISEYNLTTVTYGTASAPFLAIRTLQQLAKDDELLYPMASKIILHDTYVDDVVSGAHTVHKAREASTQLINLLKGGGFHLRKWTSNDKSLLKGIPEEDREASATLDLDNETTIRALGVNWNPSTDKFKIKVNIDNDSNPTTKRNVLSEAARIFDPIGILSPVTMTIKILFQDIWTLGASWDERLPNDILTRWKQIKLELPKLEKVEVPRWIRYTGPECDCELHGFCDASEKGYSAVVYLRTVKNNSVSTALITAKTKVAPLKSKLSVPRLELCGATLLANLIKETRTNLEIDNLPYHAWTDSMIVLAWLQEDAHKWKTFVGNRVAQIHSVIDRTKWFHVRSSENPADVASRGILPAMLREHVLWWEGPSWLKNEKIYYPPKEGSKTDIEKKILTTHTVSKPGNPEERPQEKNIYQELTKRYSSLGKLQRVVAYLKRFTCNIRMQKEHRKAGDLTVDEIEKALIPLVRTTQKQEFSEEIMQLEQQHDLSKKSRLAPLAPFLDQDGILRVGGRLEQAEVSYDRKHPIILPYKSSLTTLVMDKTHKETLHGGNTLTLEVIRQRFWILNGLKAVKGHVHGCTKCHRHRAQMSQQMMGMLPKARIITTAPFTHSGVDYAGPFELLLARGRGNRTHKGYISVFICLTTKAMHLEVVTDLTSQAFIAAFKRFVARRGPVAHIYSDNATNFVGANRILSELHKQEAYQNEVHQALREVGTQWHFIPPASPHFGGLWEAGVKAVKHHMRRVIGENKLTYEEMCTLMAQIEACLNSRPLCPLSEDPESLEVLTPGHFLTGSALLTAPEKNHLEENPNLLNKWHRLEKMHQEFWKKWSAEYLSRLQQRPKWAQRQPNLKIGNLVLMKDEQLPPTRWALGRIIDTHPGDDGLIRVVTLKTRGSIMKRPITKISLLPIIENHLEETTDSTTRPTSNEEAEQGADVNTPPKDLREIIQRKRHKATVQETTTNSKRKRHDRTIPTNSTAGTNSYLSWMTLALLVLVVVGQEPERPYRLTEFNRQEGIYFEDVSTIQLYSSEWNLVIYYDLTVYWKEFFGIKKAIRSLSELCEQSTRLSIPAGFCNATILQLKHQLIESEQINEVLYQQNENIRIRSKRAPLEIIGSIANGLFGILDQDFAEKYERQIKNIQENEDVLRQLLRNQTSITEKTINVIKKSSEAVNHQLNIFERHIQVITEGVNKAEEELKTTQTFTSAVMLVTLNLINFQHMQKNILSVITDTKHGRLNTLILTPVQLHEQLIIIKEHLPHNLRVPGNGSTTSLLAIYKSMHVKMRITQKNVLFDVRIPLLSTEAYHLYKLIPIPVPYDGNYIFIQPSSPYLAVNLHRDRFSPLTREELRECVQLSDSQLICSLKQPVYSLKSNQSRCEMDLLNRQREMPAFCQIKSMPLTKLWRKLHIPSTWLYTMDNETQIDVICGDSTYSVTLTGSGIIQLQSTCMIKHPTLFISGNNQYPGVLNSSFIPENEIISNHLNALITNQNTSQYIAPRLTNEITSRDISELYSEIKNQQEQIKQIPKVNIHDLHHYGGLYILALIVTMLASYYCWRNRRAVTQPQSDPPKPTPRQLKPKEETTVILELPSFNLKGENVQGP